MDITLYLAMGWQSLSKEFQVACFTLFALYVAYMIYVAVTDRVVIYFDDADYISNLVCVCCLVIGIVLFFYPDPFQSMILNGLYHYVLTIGLLTLALVLFIRSSIYSYFHNKNVVVGILATLFKFLYAVVSTIGVLVLLLLAIASLFNAVEKADEKEYVKAVGYLAGSFVSLEAVYLVFRFATKSLINGGRVYEPVVVLIMDDDAHTVKEVTMTLNQLSNEVWFHELMEWFDINELRWSRVIQNESLERIEELDFCFEGLRNFPILFKHFGDVKRVCLALNNLDHIPTFLFELTKLEVLELDMNNLSVIPSSIGNIVGLRRLLLGSNNLIFLPDVFDKLDNLEYLDLKNNDLMTLPQSISKLKRLEYLNLSGNTLLSIPTWLSNLSSLRKIVVSKGMKYQGLMNSYNVDIEVVEDV